MKRIFLATGLALAFAGCKHAEPAPVYIKVPVEHRDIVVAASAAGAIQPVLTVDVKSQASGAITEMRHQTGDDVRPGQLLALIDPRLPRNALDQADASLEQARAQYENAAAQLAREDTLYKAQAITQTEYENAKVAYATAKAGLVNATSNKQDAQVAYEQTRVTAPLAGTVIQKNVELGTVISSPLHDVGGGTVLFKMANLDTVQVQAMVDETDIGKVQPGLPVTITVDAYPRRPFEGSVLKIEPQAQVTQNVTMFPVLVNIANPGHLLKPGMNTEVEIHVGQRQNVLAIPNAALRTQQDVASAARVLGLDPQKVMQDLAADQAPAAAPRAGGDTAARSAVKGTETQASDSGAVMTTPDGRRIPLPKGVTAEQVRAIFQKRFSGGQLTSSEQEILSQVRSQFQRSGGARRGAGGFGQSDGDAGGRGGRMGSARATDTPASYIVFVLHNGKPAPVTIHTGLTDLDYVEVTSGLTERDTVLLLPSASLVQAQEQFKQRFQNITGGGLPGLRQQQQQQPSSGARANPR